MSGPHVLSARIRRADPAFPLPVHVHGGGLDDFQAPAGPFILVLARPDLLALVPVSGDAAAVLRLLGSCGGDFSAFPACQRRWTDSSVLEIHLLAALQTLAAGGLPHGVVSLYLNGAFERKYFAPDASLRNAPAPPAIPDDSCRDRIRDPQAILRAFGAESILGLTLDCAPDRESYYCFSNQTGLLGIGRGTSDRQMMLGAILEYLERWASYSLPASAVEGAWCDFPGQALRPDEVLGLDPALCAAAFPHYGPARRMQWLPCRRAHDGTEGLIPAQMVNYLLDTDVPIGFNRNSSGCALGNSAEEAALFGALEVIERDALLATWYSKSVPPRLRLDDVGDRTTNELLSLIDMAGYDVRCYDITLEFDVPSVMVLLLGRAEHNLAVFVTAATHPSPAVALRSSLAESWSLLLTGERNFRRRRQSRAAAGADPLELGADNQLLYYAHPEHRHHVDFLLGAPASLSYVDYLACYPFTPQRPAAAYAALVARLRSLGYPLLVCDNTVPMMRPFGLSSARVFIPGTINMVFGDHPIHLPQGRLARAYAGRAWVRDVPVPLRPQLHPLG